MGGFLARASKIIGITCNSLAEMVYPDSVGDDARGKDIFRICDPIRQSFASSIEAFRDGCFFTTRGSADDSGIDGSGWRKNASASKNGGIFQGSLARG